MKLRFKVKHLLLSVLVLIFAVGFAIPKMALIGGEQLEKRKEYEKAIVLYEGYLKMFPFTYRDEVKYALAEASIIRFSRGTFFWAGGSGYSNEPVAKEKIERAGRLFEELAVESKKTQIRKNSYIGCLDLCLFTGDVKGLKKWIAWGEDSEKESIRYVSDLYASYLDLANRKYQAAYDRIYPRYSKSPLRDPHFDYLMQLLALYDGSLLYERPEGYFEREVFAGNRSLLDWEIQKYEEKMKGEYRLSGKVHCDGEPMPFVNIISEPDLNTYSSFSLPLAISDEKGEFVTLPLRKRSYNPAIEVPMGMLYDRAANDWGVQRYLYVAQDETLDFDFAKCFEIRLTAPMNGKVQEETPFTLEWEPQEEAAYYEVHGSNVPEKNGEVRISALICDLSGSEKLTQTKMTSTIGQINKRNGGYSWDDQGISPRGVLGTALKGGRMMFFVKAYDEQGRMIKTSEAAILEGNTIPMLLYDEVPDEGERYFMSRQYTKASAYYQRVLEQEPENEKALRYLMRYYARNASIAYENESYQGEKVDLDLALEWIIRYHRLYQDSEQVLDLLWGFPAETLVKHKAEVTDLLSQIEQGGSCPDCQRVRGDIAKAEGDLRSAYEYYEQMQEDYMQDRLIEYDIYFGDLKRAIRRIDETEGFFTAQVAKEDLREALLHLEKAKDSKEYSKVQEMMRRHIMERRYEKIKENIRNFDPEFKDSNIRFFMEVFKQENHLDEEYGVEQENIIDE